MAMTLATAAAIKESNEAISASIDQVHTVCESLFALLLEQVKEGKEVTLNNVLKFKRTLNRARVFRRPNSDEVVQKPERYSLSVKVLIATKLVFEQLVVVPEPVVVKPSRRKAVGNKPVLMENVLELEA